MFNNKNIVLKLPSYKLIVVNNTNRDINIYIYNMTTPKMIESVNHAFIEPIIRTPVDNTLFCSGGGIAAAFFTIGAIKQLIDNNKFLNTFDIISATSGSVISLLLVELCYDNNVVGVVPDWYERYVVQTLKTFYNNN